MMRPFVMLNRRSCVIAASAPIPMHAPQPRNASPRARCRQEANRQRWRRPKHTVGAALEESGRPLQLAAGLVLRRRGLVAGDHVIDAEQVLGVARRLDQRLPHESRGHELMVALAVIALVGLKPDLGGELETAERLRELPRIEGLLLVRN